MALHERMKMVAKSYGTTVSAIEKELGFGNSYFANVKKLSVKAGKALGTLYPDLNLDWLASGRGSIFGNDISNGMQVGTTIPLLPVSMQGGSLTEFEAQVEDYECEKIISPIISAQLAATVSGESMAPEYPNGCIVLLRKIDEDVFIEWGRTYALDTINGAVIKNVFPSQRDASSVTCRSVNPNYSDFDIRKEDIRAWYRVVGLFTTK